MKLYARPWYAKAPLFSEIDGRNPDLARFPKFGDVPLRFRLEPGESLYIPVHWWHFTRVQGYQVSVTHFWKARFQNWTFPAPGFQVCAREVLFQSPRSRSSQRSTPPRWRGRSVLAERGAAGVQRLGRLGAYNPAGAVAAAHPRTDMALDSVRLGVRKTVRMGVRMTLSGIRARRVRIPSPAFLLSPSSKKAKTPEQRRLIQQMRRDGIIKLPGLVDPETLAELQAGHQRMIEAADKRRAESAYSDEAALASMYEAETSYFYEEKWKYYSSIDPFQFVPALARFVMKDEVMSLVNSYYRKQAYVARAIGFRMLPMKRERGAYGWIWHHDAWGRKVNLQIQLSETGEDDQYVAYRKGSHLPYHPIEGPKGVQNFTDEEAEAKFGHYELVKTTGKPGDAYMFDSNGLHSLMSSEGRVRDVLVVMFYCDRTFQHSQSLPEEIVRSAPPEDLVVFEEMLKYNEWKRRTGAAGISPRHGLGWKNTLYQFWHWLF